MGLLDNFEKGLERAVNGAFARTFRSGLQPVEISSALKREIDTNAAIVARDRVLVPNTFVVRLAPEDHERMTKLGSALNSELVDLVQKHARHQGFQFAGGISITLTADPGLQLGMIAVDSRSAQGQVTWTPVLEVNGSAHPLTASRTVIGRGAETDLPIDDPRASRRHAEVLWDGRHARVRDLSSTNGTQLNGMIIRDAVLEPDSVITIGATHLTFRVLAQAASVPTSRQHRSKVWESSS
ncbi:MAG: phosphopeptide-binding protein [Candidatus Lumbricidophila eiseniae]|uniref:Phosphopeptide-binding protein n=1 Tax=Candidatus Lumbricidiphila eiseniae TaxID=1969409 RepID=A0A2A6FUN4_9MICO|nr:MAG: phosphopeptide-binding protein [Candidatus Lumbricidophila eiseniae]